MPPLALRCSYAERPKSKHALSRHHAPVERAMDASCSGNMPDAEHLAGGGFRLIFVHRIVLGGDFIIC